MAEVAIHESADVQHHHGADGHGHHGSQWKLYWGIAGVLGVATIIEVALSYFMKEVWHVSQGILAGSMMSIAIVKALLVIMYYMHLKYESRFLWLIFAIPFGLVSLLALALFAQP